MSDRDASSGEEESAATGENTPDSDEAPTPAAETERDYQPHPDDDVTFVVVTAESVTFDLADASPHLHLMEADIPYRNMSIPIALSDAQALYNALHAIEGRRPGTHELTSAILRQLQADVIAARIVRVVQGVYYAEIDVMTPHGRERFDCRTSDAVILALRQVVPAPILCAQDILESFYS